ncbi:PopZ family protein [Pararhizobium sp. YC-54]|uniref:PopZ family protein n=1 Tax=Pararhizobium sp. YC-54 TaxID=2986920 RepID=UPI0021F7C2B6|nr:PopZ family protein [Pararhizobium sp. YC-54]MCV9997156.1 PopZ family protein [Pararhizobium sp. YC-54]
MAQPNVAREPSMDEILASIRKIIESNEPGLPGFPANDLGPASDGAYRGYDDDDAEDIHLTIDDEVLAQEFEAEEQKHFTPSAPQQRELEDVSAKPAVSPPMSLADVAARVRAASERHSAPLREPENLSADTRPLSTDTRTKSDNPMVTSRMAPSSFPSHTEASQEAAPAAPVSLIQPVVAPDVRHKTAEPAEAALDQAAAARQPLSIVTEKDVAALVSPAVGEKVARSFGDLALAVDSSARRSFDEIAEDMLRPMLQEWLDDNLPTLVERLVREEIERVARGPRR